MLYVITATVNNLEYTKRLCAALTAVSPEIGIRLVIVDNGSTDGTQAWVRTLGPAVELIANEGNLGASVAWNLGIRYACANRADAILVCGNDTAPMPGTVERLCQLLRDGVLFVTGTAVPYGTPEAAVGLCEPGEALLAAPDFSFFLFRPGVCDAVASFDCNLEFNRQAQAREKGETIQGLLLSPWQYGLFDERFFPAYFEDGDYHVRLKYAGVPALRDPGALFRHDTSLTIRTNPEIGALNQNERFRMNAAIFVEKWGAPPHQLDIQQARPLNMTDEQWAALHGNRPIMELSKDDAVAQAKAVYGKYGVSA